MSADEFMKAIESNCANKPYADLPASFKAFINSVFKSIDVDGMWSFTAMIILNMKDPQDYSLLLFSTIRNRLYIKLSRYTTGIVIYMLLPASRLLGNIT